MKQLSELKPGDKVTRLIGSPVVKMNMPMIIMAVDKGIIYCTTQDAPEGTVWEFNQQTGGEVDWDLGWDGTNFTGSTIVPV